MTRLPFWIAGVAGSIVAHAAMLALVMWSVQPDPVVEQPMPSSEIEVQAYQLKRTSAREKHPDSPAANTSNANGAALAAGAIPHSQATAIDTPATGLAGIAPTPVAVEAAAADSAQLTQVQRQSRLETVQAAPTTLISAPTLPTKITSINRVLPPLPQAHPSATAPRPIAPAVEILAAVQRAQPALAAAIPTTTGQSAQPTPTALPAVIRTLPAPSMAIPIAPAAKNTASIAVVLAAVVRPQSARLTTIAPTLTPPNIPPTPVILAAVLRTPPPLPQVQPALDAVSASSDQTARPSAAIVPIAVPLPQAAPVSDALSQTAAVTYPAAQAPQNAHKLKASLAFLGGGNGDVDPVSLAAFQSFMQPEDIQTTGNTLRDGVAALLAQVPCSRLQVGFDPDTATLRVDGHIPDTGLRGPVLAALRSQMGADITISDNMLILPRPQCGALSGIADVGLAQSTDQITNPLIIGQDAHVRVLQFVQNDRLFFDITAPDYDAYVYVDYFDADGNVLHLAPNDQVPLVASPAETALRIGRKHAEDSGLQILIGPPYGQEITVAFAASAPLYDGLRPIIEPAAPYLEWLKIRVAETQAKHADFKGEWVYFFITTAEN